MRLLIDSRESADPHPWVAHFSEDVKVERGMLDVGDFALSALPDAAVVERKSGPDLYQCLGRERERFQKELARGRYVGRMIVVVECNLSDVLTLAHARYGGMSVNAIFGTLASWQRKYCPFFFAGSPANAAHFAERFLRGQITEVERTAKVIEKAEASAS